MTASNPQAVSIADQNAILIQLCVKVLKNISPNGMTTKELAAELDKEVHHPGFNGISSSILSSKLNAVFRRCHNDSPHPNQDQLAELPLTRSQSSDVPRRLVYRYTPPQSVANVESPTPVKRQVSEVSDDGSISPTLSTTGFSSDGETHNEPMTPKEDNSSWSSSKRRKTRTASVSDEQPAVHRPHTPPNTGIKKPLESQGPRVNLYYDVVGYDAMTAVFANASVPASPVNSLDEVSSSNKESDTWTEEVASPEHLELNELDTLVC